MSADRDVSRSTARRFAFLRSSRGTLNVTFCLSVTQTSVAREYVQSAQPISGGRRVRTGRGPRGVQEFGTQRSRLSQARAGPKLRPPANHRTLASAWTSTSRCVALNDETRSNGSAVTPSDSWGLGVRRTRWRAEEPGPISAAGDPVLSACPSWLDRDFQGCRADEHAIVDVGNAASLCRELGVLAVQPQGTGYRAGGHASGAGRRRPRRRAQCPIGASKSSAM